MSPETLAAQGLGEADPVSGGLDLVVASDGALTAASGRLRVIISDDRPGCRPSS